MSERERRVRDAFEQAMRKFLAVAEPGTSGRITLHWGSNGDPVPGKLEAVVTEPCVESLTTAGVGT